MAETIPSLGVPSGYEESGIMILRNKNNTTAAIK
jgi:hypothetical protein